MGCATSKKLSTEDDVVSFCGERKCLVKLALVRRYAFAEAYSKYNQSLYSMALALRLFVARHSSPSSPFLITYPSNLTSGTATLIDSPVFLQHKPSEPRHEGTPEGKESEDRRNCDEKDEEVSNEEEPLCEHFYGDVGAPSASPRRSYQWDFFNLFDVRGLTQNTDEGSERMGRGKGVMDEIKATRNRDDAKLEARESENLRQINREIDGWELLEALKDVEDHFMKAHNSEGSRKLIRSITWNRSNSLHSSSSKSLLISSWRSSSSSTELGVDSCDECGGMGSGSHASTIERLYAWEKKLYEEVKAGEEIWKLFERKRSRFRNKKARKDYLEHGDKSTAEVIELHTSLLVSAQAAESISKRIQKLKKEELLPQLVELLNGLMRYWKMMLESHETQYQILNQVRFFNCPAYGNFCNSSHRLATIGLEAELHNWRTCLAAIVSAEKAYIEALHGWVSKFTVSEVDEIYSWGIYSTLPCKINKPPILEIFHDWLAWLEKMPDKKVTTAIKSFGKEVQSLWAQQGKELRQKRKVDELAKEVDRRSTAFQREECRILGPGKFVQEADVNVRTQIQYLLKQKDLLEIYRKKLDAGKAKHQVSMLETQHITLEAFQSDFCCVLESLAEFSKASIEVYASLVTFSENAKMR
ncbi:protein ALTERED PHOSPHATE STARVATION RESPONSE 1-like isoform X2 [Prosopis cineraria]|uniref:protein ALTERED PHOSPHATE STARVATION RESPONSE 1-like isoform X2 n=1 Tax=Prosopis cineraria TaxID=364024 RepID=UPI00240FB589|nr:protein ALTERED PHOSPHATE STARVATION RESPONSE 1-like isoform X2 [Prosopis cineraria]